MLTINLPFPVSANQYWQIQGKRLIKSKKAREYISNVTYTWLQAKASQGLKPFEKGTTLALAIAVYYPVRRGPDLDLDNAIKVLIDSMETAGIFFNDNQFRYIQISREKPEDKFRQGLVRVNIKECPDVLELHDGTFIVKEIHGVSNMRKLTIAKQGPCPEMDDDNPKWNI